MVVITTKRTGLAIREYLLQVGEGYPYEFYTIFREIKPTTSYDSVRRYFYILKEIGLITPTRKVKGRGNFPIQLYMITPGMENDPRWAAPQSELYPATKLGRNRYIEAKQSGAPIPRGRSPRYMRW